MASITSIGAPAKKVRAAKKPAAAAAVAVAPAKRRKRKAATTEVAAPKKRRVSRGGSRSGMMGKLDVQGKAVAVGGAWLGQKFLAGKTIAGIPQTLVAGVAVEHFQIGGKDYARPAATGLVVIGAVEYAVIQAISAGKIKELLGPYIEEARRMGGNAKVNGESLAAKIGYVSSTAGDGDASGADMSAVADRMASGG